MSLVAAPDSRVQISHHAFRSESIDETIEAVRPHLWRHRMKVTRSTHSVRSHLVAHLIDDFSVLDLQYGATVEVTPEEAPDYYLVHIPLSGHAELHYGSNKVMNVPGKIAISAPSTLTRVCMDEDSRHLDIRIDRSSLENHLSRMLGHDIYSPLIFEQESSQSAAGSALITTVNNIFQQAKTVPEMFVHRQIVDQYKTLLMSILTSMFKHSYSQLMIDGHGAPVPWHVRQAKEYIENNLGDYLSLAKVAEFAGVSVRTLQNGFRQFEGTAPAEYIRNRRLHSLHQALQAADPTHQVTDIMLDNGITSFGRYAQYYQERYCCLPSETLKK